MLPSRLGALVPSQGADDPEVSVGVYGDCCLVVKGHPSLPVGLVFVPLSVQDWGRFGLVRPMEGLFQEPEKVCALVAWLAAWQPWWGRR